MPKSSESPATRTTTATPEYVRPVSHEATLPRLGAEETYGVWLAEEGATTSWLRLEKPRFRVVTVDAERKLAWVMNGCYAFARDGSVFAALSEIGQVPEAAQLGLCWNDEKSLRGLAMSKVMLPWRCDFRADGQDLKVADFRGPTFNDDRDRWHARRYRKVAMARPGYAGALSPIGNWERRPPETRDRVLLQFLPDQLGVTIVEGTAGKRTRLHGEYAATPDGLLYGMFTTIDRAFGREQPQPLTPAPLFCLRLGFTSNRLEVRDMESVDLDEGIRSRLKGEYAPAGRP